METDALCSFSIVISWFWQWLRGALTQAGAAEGQDADGEGSTLPVIGEQSSQVWRNIAAWTPGSLSKERDFWGNTQWMCKNVRLKFQWIDFLWLSAFQKKSRTKKDKILWKRPICSVLQCESSGLHLLTFPTLRPCPSPCGHRRGATGRGGWLLGNYQEMWALILAHAAENVFPMQRTLCGNSLVLHLLSTWTAFGHTPYETLLRKWHWPDAKKKM